MPAWCWVRTARFKEDWNEAARNRDILEVIQVRLCQRDSEMIPSSPSI
jgi:hypothetical protein